MRLALVLAALAAAAPPGAATPAPGTPVHDLGWRAARWGMSVEQVLAAFPGEARAVVPALRLADGNVVAVELPDQVLGGAALRARLVFSGEGLALVSLRTPEDRPATPEDYARVCAALAAALGGPGEVTRDDEFIDLRQTRWRLGRTAVDAKYIPGVLAVVWFPWPPGGGSGTAPGGP